MSHITVLLDETINALLASANGADGIYVDATFGRGGHSRALLARLSDKARLVVFDKDPEAIRVAHDLAASDTRISVIHDGFATMDRHLTMLGINKVDGMMADLGVSSPQLDDGARGFSFMRDGVVDMRMDTSRGQSVGQWLSQVDETTLADVLYQYGEERHSRRIARAIKAMGDYNSTLKLAQVIKDAHPNWQKGKHPATQSFQAMRIFINNELGELQYLLAQSMERLAIGGVLAIISFHSLEDRMVKNFLREHGKKDGFFAKPVRIDPSVDEIAHNARARSAHLRVAVVR